MIASHRPPLHSTVSTDAPWSFTDFENAASVAVFLSSTWLCQSHAPAIATTATMTAVITAVIRPECRAKKLSSASDTSTSSVWAGTGTAGGANGSAGGSPVGWVPFGSVLMRAVLSSQGFGGATAVAAQGAHRGQS